MLKYIPDNNVKMNTEFPPKRIAQLIMPTEHKEMKETMLTCNIAFNLSYENEDHTQDTYFGNLKPVVNVLLGAVNYSAKTDKYKSVWRLNSKKHIRKTNYMSK
jgi:hypothetical protein